MNSICMVCNGLTRMQAPCPTCNHLLDDSGRLADYFGDYSPYMEIDDSKLSNGYPDLLQHLCLHVTWCPVCRQQQLVVITEQSEAEVLRIEGRATEASLATSFS
ncbi:hypothetical protein ACQCN2_19200 [Brevibacillus ginsengisoli]|uniref:hypothetical protein n=1 Tax=Brevibacillus ginsengisoli TaxID=363854 RepID=UPI003CEB020A